MEDYKINITCQKWLKRSGSFHISGKYYTTHAIALIMNESKVITTSQQWTLVNLVSKQMNNIGTTQIFFIIKERTVSNILFFNHAPPCNFTLYKVPMKKIFSLSTPVSVQIIHKKNVQMTQLH